MEMKKKTDYQQPNIKVCDYWSRNGICIEYDPDITTSEVLGKRGDYKDEEETDESYGHPRSVWDAD